MELSEFVTTLVERNVLYYPKQEEGFIRYYVDSNNFELLHNCFIQGWLPIHTIAVFKTHNDGIRLEFLDYDDISDEYYSELIKPYEDDDSFKFDYDSFELSKLVRQVI
jgi:hypothetical protein